MKLLISEEEFACLKSRELAPLECAQCHNTFYKQKHNIQAKNHNKHLYCSCACKGKTQAHKIEVICANCGKPVMRVPSHANTKNIFCSNSCSVTYNNKHKSHGTRRSKLELYLEDKIRNTYPDLELLCNSKETIESELDFYFPTLKLSIELNGIFHYEPIYGKDKLERIQDNDKQKAIRCYEKGIEFCSIDSSSCKHFTDKSANNYWLIIQELLDNLLSRNY